MTNNNDKLAEQKHTAFLMVGDDYVEYFLNDGWEIVASAPNPFPQPYIYFCIKKQFDHELNRNERSELFENARIWLNSIS